MNNDQPTDEAKRKIEELIRDANTYCDRVWIENDRLCLTGGRAKEFLEKLERYQEHSIAADWQRFMYAERSSAQQSLDRLLNRLRRREGDILYQSGESFNGFECGPRLITVVGAPPGAGKTAITMQYIFELLANDPNINVVIANAEMPFDVLLKREITRRSGIPGRAIRFADLTPHQLERVEAAASDLEPLLARIKVMNPPFTVESLNEYWGTDPGLLVLDYLQKFAGGDDARIGVNEVVGTLRTLAHDGWGILALSATTRSRGKGGSSHDSANLSMASFKESGEIEFNADACYLLRDMGPVNEADQRIRNVTLDCVKNRHDVQQPIELVFDMPHMTFRRPEQDVEPNEDLIEWNAESTFLPIDESYEEASF